MKGLDYYYPPPSLPLTSEFPSSFLPQGMTSSPVAMAPPTTTAAPLSSKEHQPSAPPLDSYMMDFRTNVNVN